MPEQKPKLLVVDDEIEQCATIKSYFSRRNFSVFTASSGEAALASISKNKPDLVLLDMKLSGKMDGKGVLRSLRQYDKDTKVVIITGDLLSEQAIQGVTDLGIIDFLIKPLDFKTLEKTIKKALESKYPKAVHFKKAKVKEDSSRVLLRRIRHDLSNIASDIANKCELCILDTEEGVDKGKSEKERLDEAIDILKSVLKSTERLTELINRISSLVNRNNTKIN